MSSLPGTSREEAIGNNQGRINVVMTGKEMAAPLVAVNGILLKPGTDVMIAVSDDGCGMSAEIQAKVFDPFFTTKTVSEETGLGLSVVLGIVKRHGGAITLTGVPGEGTIFCLYFPVCEDIIPTSGQMNAHELRGEETILLVNDEHLLVQMFAPGIGTPRVPCDIIFQEQGCTRLFFQPSGYGRPGGHRYDHARHGRGCVQQRAAPAQAGSSKHPLHRMQ